MSHKEILVHHDGTERVIVYRKREKNALPLDAFRPGAIIEFKNSCTYGDRAPFTHGTVARIASNGIYSWLAYFSHAQQVWADGRRGPRVEIVEEDRFNHNSPSFLHNVMNFGHATRVIQPSQAPLKVAAHEHKPFVYGRERHGNWIKIDRHYLRELLAEELAKLTCALGESLSLDRCHQLLPPGIYHEGKPVYFNWDTDQSCYPSHHDGLFVNMKRLKKWLKANHNRLKDNKKQLQREQDELDREMYEREMDMEDREWERTHPENDNPNSDDDGSDYDVDDRFPVSEYDDRDWDRATAEAYKVAEEVLAEKPSGFDSPDEGQEPNIDLEQRERFAQPESLGDLLRRRLDHDGPKID